MGTRHVQIFLPSVTRDERPLPGGQAAWVEECLSVLGRLFGGATAFPPGRGVWRDDERGGRLVFDETVIVLAYVAEELLTGAAGTELHEWLLKFGRETDQGEVGVVVDGTYRGFRNFGHREEGDE